MSSPHPNERDGLGRDDDRIAVELLLQLSEDRACGRELGLRHYLARFPEHAETVARVWVEAQREVNESAPATGRIGRYRRLEELGRGGQGVVYLAEDESLGRRVALKVLHPGVAPTDDARLRFQREARLASKLTHPGLCTVYETGSSDGVEFIAMRYVPGGSLAQAIRAAGEGSAPERPREAVLSWVECIEKVARALHTAHEHGVVHRDIKPSNILLDESGNPVLVDFGLARDQSRVGFTLTGSGDIFGTPEYMSPEQLHSSTHLDRRTDVYSLGVVLFKALALETPFAGATVKAVLEKIQRPAPPVLRGRVPGVDRDLEIVIATAMEVDLARRYQSALEFADDLARVRRTEPIHARRAGVLLRARRWCQRNPVLATTAALLTLSLASVFALTTWFRSTADALTAERDEAIGGMTRLTDKRQSAELLERERAELWPVGPALLGPADEWLRRADTLLLRRAEHSATLAQLRERRTSDGGYANVDESILDELLSETLSDLDQLDGRRALVVQRRARSASLAARSIERFAEAWEDCRRRIALSERYGGLNLEPQVGLVPLGENAAGYWEFWHVESGARPSFEDSSGAQPADDAGCVLVLLPGGNFAMGSQPPGAAGGGLHELNVDADTQLNEMPVHTVRLAPFFLSKFELTQAQWVAANEGRNPSTHQPGKEMVTGENVGWTHPVQDVTWFEARATARRLALELPTEAQWEYACRAGSTAAFAWGDAKTSAALYANFHAREANDSIGGNLEVTDYADRHVRIAPVGAYAANAYGLHDLHGNLWEWCLDRYAPYANPTSGPAAERSPDPNNEQRAIRGGCFQYPAFYGRSARRVPVAPDNAAPDLGVRFARHLNLDRE